MPDDMTRTPKERGVLFVRMRFPGWYAKYLKSPSWKARRNRIAAERETCEICGDPENLEVHHLSYEHLFDEPDEELLLVCALCHETIHRLEQVPVSFGETREQFFKDLDDYLTRCIERTAQWKEKWADAED